MLGRDNEADGGPVQTVTVDEAAPQLEPVDTIADLNRQIAGRAAAPVADAPVFAAPAVVEAEVVTEPASEPEPEAQPRRRRPVAAAPEPVAELVPQEAQDDGYDLPESPFGGDE